MTKTVRIENADNNTGVEVVVEIQHQDGTGAWQTVESQPAAVLQSPCQQYENHLTSTRRLIVSERPRKA
ncbi:MAG: hypothetical protein AB7P99_14265 [Vicinamibacterales bacterium]